MAEGVRRRVVPRRATWPGGPEVPVLAETVLERGMLKTHVGACGMDVTTLLDGCEHCARSHPWSAVWRPDEGGPRLLWLRYYDGPTTPGGLEEAHHHVVAQVRAGTLPGPPVPEREVGRGG